MISVIIPLYNKEPIIERSLRSILSQDYDDFEVIIVNDGSTDKSAEIVRSVNDPRIRLIEQENGGPSKARNTGIKLARGDWYYLIDADDEMLPGSLNHINEITLRYPESDMILGETLISNEGSLYLVKEYNEGFMKNMFKSHIQGRIHQCSGTTLYKRITTCNVLFNESIRRYEDLERLFRLYRFAKVRTTHKPLSKINVNYSAASCARNDINEDFLGHLDFNGKSFWEKICLYKFYLGERPRYTGQVEKLYPILKYRYDYLLISKIIAFVSQYITKNGQI